MGDKGSKTKHVIAAENNTIAAMEGIFVKANEDGETVTFATGAKRGSASMAGIVANLSQDCGTVVDRVIVRFGEGETLPKLQIHDNSTKVYIPQDGKDYAIVNAQAQGELPLGFKPATNGTYTLAVNAEGIEMEYLHLIDNMTGADVDLIPDSLAHIHLHRQDDRLCQPLPPDVLSHWRKR